MSNEKQETNKQEKIDPLRTLEVLQQKAQKLKAKQQKYPSEKNQDNHVNGMQYGIHFLTDFIGAILLGTALGWVIDKICHSSPLALITGLFLGFVTGVYILVKKSMPEKNQSSPTSKKK